MLPRNHSKEQQYEQQTREYTIQLCVEHGARYVETVPADSLYSIQPSSLCKLCKFGSLRLGSIKHVDRQTGRESISTLGSKLDLGLHLGMSQIPTASKSMYGMFSAGYIFTCDIYRRKKNENKRGKAALFSQSQFQPHYVYKRGPDNRIRKHIQNHSSTKNYHPISFSKFFYVILPSPRREFRI